MNAASDRLKAFEAARDLAKAESNDYSLPRAEMFQARKDWLHCRNNIMTLNSTMLREAASRRSA